MAQVSQTTMRMGLIMATLKAMRLMGSKDHTTKQDVCEIINQLIDILEKERV